MVVVPEQSHAEAANDLSAVLRPLTAVTSIDHVDDAGSEARTRRRRAGLGWVGMVIQDWAVDGLGESRRRPQWRGERKAVLVRMPVALAEDLARSAARERRSVSEHVTTLLTQVMRGQDGT